MDAGQEAPKYAACVVDSGLVTTYEDSCSYANTDGMIIRTGTFYGSSYELTVKYSIDPTQIPSFLSSSTSDGIIRLTLQVNRYLSPDGNPGPANAVDINLLTPMLEDQEHAPVLLYEFFVWYGTLPDMYYLSL